EARASALEIDDVELVLVVRGPGQRLALDAHARMRRLERAQELGQRVGVAEDARVLEDERDGAALVAGAAAAEREEPCHQPERPRRTAGDNAQEGRWRASRRASPLSGMPSHVGRLSSS